MLAIAGWISETLGARQVGPGERELIDAAALVGHLTRPGITYALGRCMVTACSGPAGPRLGAYTFAHVAAEMALPSR